MKLPHLDRHVALQRGDADTAALAIGRYLTTMLRREQYREVLHWHELLAAPQLERLRRRLVTRHQSEVRQQSPALPRRRGQRPKLRLLRVPFLELVALREQLPRIEAASDGDLVVAHVLGLFHQASTGLEAYIRFSGS